MRTNFERRYDYYTQCSQAIGDKICGCHLTSKERLRPPVVVNGHGLFMIFLPVCASLIVSFLFVGIDNGLLRKNTYSNYGKLRIH